MTIWETARASGELVYRFRQGESPVLTQPGPWGRTLPSRVATDGDNAKYNGYCAALATHWANLRMSDMDFVYDKQTSRLDGIAHWRATKEQSLYRDGAGLKALLASYGFSFKQFLNCRSRPTGHAIAQAAADHTGALYISLKRNGGGHGVAVQSERHGGQEIYHYFDANFGHFQFESVDRFAAWLDDFLKNVSGYHDRYDHYLIYRLNYDKQQRVQDLIRRFGG